MDTEDKNGIKSFRGHVNISSKMTIIKKYIIHILRKGLKQLHPIHWIPVILAVTT